MCTEVGAVLVAGVCQGWVEANVLRCQLLVPVHLRPTGLIRNVFTKVLQACVCGGMFARSGSAGVSNEGAGAHAKKGPPRSCTRCVLLPLRMPSSPCVS